MVTNSDKLQNGIAGVLGKVEGIVSDHTLATIGGVAIGSVIAGTVIGGAISSKSSANKSNKRSNKKKRRRITHTSRGWKQDRKRFNKSQKWEVAYRKRKKKHSKKSRSKKGIHYTKNGQPYKILASGKARFIKKR